MTSATVFWLKASPRDPSTAITTDVYLAGGGADRPYVRGGVHYRSGLVSRPLFATRIGFDAGGWNGETQPQASRLEFAPHSPELFDELRSYFWEEADIEIDAGPEDGAFGRIFTGTVSSVQMDDGKFILTMADLSRRLAKVVCDQRFAGDGDAEGTAEATGRIKRRSWGHVFNIEGRLVDPANSIHEFGDPAFPFTGWSALRDKGRAGDFEVLAWQGSIAGTFAALQASAPEQGGGVVAPSIAMAKWWTDPAGPLTADVIGTPGTGNSMTAAALIDAISQEFDGPEVTALAAANALRPGIAGIHAALANLRASQLLDEIALKSSLVWKTTPAGDIELTPWSFDCDETVLQGEFIGREKAFPPHYRRKLGYQIAERTHGDNEIAAVLDIPIEEIPEAIGIDDGATRNTDIFNDDMDYASTAAFLKRWNAIAPNVEGSIAPVDDSAAPGGRAMAFAAAEAGGGDAIVTGGVSSSSLHGSTTGNSVAALSDGVFDAGASALGTDKETDPWIIRDLGSVQSVGNIKFAPISSDVAGPGDGLDLAGILTASSNYGANHPALPNDGSHLHDGLYAGNSHFHATDADGGAPYIRRDLGSDQFVASIKVGPVTSGDPNGWQPFYTNGSILEVKAEGAGAWTEIDTIAGLGDEDLFDYPINANIRHYQIRKTVVYIAVAEFYAVGPGTFGVAGLDGAKVRISSLDNPDPEDEADWTEIETIAGTIEGALSTIAVNDDFRHLQIIALGANKFVGLSELQVFTPVVGGSTEDSLEFESVADFLLNPGSDNRMEIVAAGIDATASNFEAGISVFDGEATRTRLNIAADQDDVPSGYTRFTGYFRAETGAAVEPAPDPVSPCLMPAGAIRAKARFLCDTGNDQLIRVASIKIREIADRTGEAGADVTANSVPLHSGSASIEFTANYSGVLDEGQLPRNLVYRRIKGDSDVSASAAWSIVSQSGITGGVVTVANGGITIPDGVTIAASGAKIVVRSVRDGVTIDSEIAVYRKDAAPPGSGGGGTGTVDSVSSFASISTNSFVSITGTRTVHTGSGGEIDFAMSLTISGEPAFPPGEYEVELKFRYRPVSGSYSDVASATYSDPNLFIINESGFYYVEEYGAVALYQTKSSLTADTDYEWEILARRTSASLTKTLAITGSASATGN